MLVTSIFSFSHNVFKSLLSQVCEKYGLIVIRLRSIDCTMLVAFLHVTSYRTV